MITMDTITAAQANDIAAITAVVEATETRVEKLAAHAARRMTENGGNFADYRDEFAQVGRIAVWESLPRFTGTDVDTFFGFIYSTVENALLDAVRTERNPQAGADKDAMKVFVSMLALAEDDPYLAEKYAQTVPEKGRRLSADRANAARLAWEGTYSLDKPIMGLTDERSYTGPSTLSGKGAGDMVRGDMMVSTYGVPDDLVTPEDLNAEASRQKHAVVNAILDTMGANQRNVIRHSFGIGGATFYGHGAYGDDEGLGAELGLTVAQVRPARAKGLKKFAEKYVAYVRGTAGDAEADAYADAASKNIGRQR